MARYYVNANENEDDHEVHIEDCTHGADEVNRIDLGEHSSCETAVDLAKTHFPNADGCAHCSGDCHTGQR